MGKAAIIAILAFGVTGAYYSMGTQRSMVESDARVADYQYEVLARNAALVGHDRAELALAGCTASLSSCETAFTGTYEGIAYETRLAVDGATISLAGVTVTAGTGEAAILSTAYVPDDTFRIRTTYEQRWITSSGGGQVPTFMQYGLLSDKDLTLTGNTSAEVFRAGSDESNKLNANMHTNGDFLARGNVSVQGFVTSAGSARVVGNTDIEPNYNPTGADPVQGYTDEVEIPAFDAEAYWEKVCGDEGPTCKKTGSVEITGNEDINFPLGTREEPFVWFIDGTLKVTGNVDFDGYVAFITTEGVKIAGNVEMGTTDYEGPDESHVAFYSAGDFDIDLHGNTTLSGQIFTSDDVNFNGSGNVDIYGSITTGGAVNLAGNVEIRYRKASSSLTRGWEKEVPKMFAIAHSEW